MKMLLRVVPCALFFLSTSLSQSIIQVIPLPQTTYWDQAWGLAADTSSLYVSSGTDDAILGRRIMKLSLTGTVLDSVTIPAGYTESQGLARDGSGNFYYVRRYTATCTIVKFSPTGALVDSLRTSRYIGGVAWDGSYLWFTAYYPNNEAGLVKVNWATKTLVDTILVPTRQPYGATWDGTYLYYAENGFDGDRRGIFRVNPVTGDTAGFIPEPVDPNGTSPHGCAWDGRYMWLLAEPVGANSGRALYKYDLGGGGTPDINLSLSLLDFGQVRLGQYRQLSVSIQNVGTAPLRLDSVRVLLSTHFAPTLSTPVTIQPNASVTMPVTFTPAQFGPDTGSAVIYCNDPDEGAKPLALRGSGIYGSAIISVPASYSYGTRRVGSSNSWKLTAQNLGGDPLVISSITLSDPAFRLDSVVYPVTLDSLATRIFRVWYLPASATATTDTLRINSNASNGAQTKVVLQGTGDATPALIGVPLWTYTVVDHPISNTGRLVKAVRAIGDITGDGKPDVVVSTENYWTMALNGNSSATNDSLWAFTTYISSYSAGSIGTTGDYSHQKALAVASDLNGDGVKDVVIGTGGGNEHVYALDGRTGHMIWTFGTDDPDSFSLGDFTAVDVSTDYNNDGVPDVIAAASATESGGIGGRRSVYLFNGTNGATLWQSPLPGFTHGVCAIGDISGDGHPDVIGAVGEPAYKASAYSGTNGALLWDFPVSSASGGGKEVMAFPVAGQTPDVILGAFWGPVYRVDGESGTQVWSHPTGGSGVMQLARLKDVTGDGVDEVLVALLGGGALCLNGANGNTVWSLPTGNTMGVAAVPDLDQDGYDEAVFAVQNQGAMIVRGQNGQQLALYSFGSNECREVATVPDMDGNNSREIIAGSKYGNIALISGGVNAGPAFVTGGEDLPEGFTVSQNYPNPFNPTTTFDVGLPVQSDLNVTIYDIIGRKVRDFTYERVPAGVHQVTWDGTSSNGSAVSSGVYLYRVMAGQHTIARHMLLIK